MSKLLLLTLADHYLAVVSGLVTEIDTVKRQLEHLLFSPTPQELQVHETILKKMEDNLSKFQKFLEERAPKKIHHLRNPTNPKPKTKTNKNNNPRNSCRKGRRNHPQPATNTNLPPPNSIPKPRSYADGAKDFRSTGHGN